MIKIPLQDAEKLLYTILKQQGISSQDAKIIANDHINGELEGKRTHGLIRFPRVVEKIEKTGCRKPKIVKQAKAFALIDGQESPGQLSAEIATQIVVKKAKQSGIAMVGIQNSHNFLRPGTFAETIARKGLIAIIVENGGAECIAAPGSSEAILGTSPLGIGIPTSEEPIVADLASSERAWGVIALSNLLGVELPPQTYLDKKGNFTQKANEVKAAVPFGGYKGFIIALMVEILGGSLVNMHMGKKNDDPYYKDVLRGALFIAIDPRMFTAYSTFCKANTKLLQQIKKTKKVKGIKEILIPGERARKNREKILKRGYFEIEENLYKTLTNLLKK